MRLSSPGDGNSAMRRCPPRSSGGSVSQIAVAKAQRWRNATAGRADCSGGGAMPGMARKGAPRGHVGGDRLQQSDGVGVGGTVEDVVRRADLDDAAGIHHGDAMSQARDDAEIVADPHERHAELLRQALDLRQDLRLDGHVEGGRRLVGDDQFGTVQKRDGDRHALPHAAGELMRIGGEALVRRGDADHAERIARALPARPGGCTFSCARTVSTICVSMLRTGLRVIIGSWKIIAIRRPRSLRISLGGKPDEILALEQDAPARHPARRIDEPEDREAGDRLARSGFADEPEHFAARRPRS